MLRSMTPASCKRFTESVTRLGGTIPKPLADTLTGFDALKAWTAPDPTAALTNAIAEGKFTPTTAAKLLEQATTTDGGNEKVAKIRLSAELALIRRFYDELKGKSGDAVIESLRPAFDTAAAAMVNASNHFSPEATADQVIDMGAEAAEVWRTLPQHRRTLDEILNVIIAWLAVDGDGPEIVGNRQLERRGDCQKVAFLMDGPRGNIQDAALALDPLRQQGRRGGRWQFVLQHTTLRLNTPTEANAILDVYENAEREARQREVEQGQGLPEGLKV
ncbi:hypothetical protein P3H15_33220 [Rhodococcus sp. T2V]|uniref:hypothetical protein n=1 Tax=Rhodococcus sp. T2V TaxID=3034164 RepID=UPI0023E0C51A|nr:hypothetical protein [Rhodococcus sp. T2V]MDF3309881.1 hypothetical protein [Rhodococcus sp. T2V]